VRCLAVSAMRLLESIKVSSMHAHSCTKIDSRAECQTYFYAARSVLIDTLGGFKKQIAFLARGP